MQGQLSASALGAVRSRGSCLGTRLGPGLIPRRDGALLSRVSCSKNLPWWKDTRKWRTQQMRMSRSHALHAPGTSSSSWIYLPDSAASSWKSQLRSRLQNTASLQPLRGTEDSALSSCRHPSPPRGPVNSPRPRSKPISELGSKVMKLISICQFL